MAPKTRSGQAISAFALTEPQSGSDVANSTMTATPDGNGYVLDGRKTWISNGGIADVYTVFARTGEAPGAKGLSAFIVPADTPGLRVEERLEVMAPHPLATLHFDGVKLPGSALLGEAGRGLPLPCRCWMSSAPPSPPPPSALPAVRWTRRFCASPAVRYRARR